MLKSRRACGPGSHGVATLKRVLGCAVCAQQPSVHGWCTEYGPVTDGRVAAYADAANIKCQLIYDAMRARSRSEVCMLMQQTSSAHKHHVLLCIAVKHRAHADATNIKCHVVPDALGFRSKSEVCMAPCHVGGGLSVKTYSPCLNLNDVVASLAQRLHSVSCEKPSLRKE
eukprot:1139304-Pelagomonas_calceolata.AAC.1